MSLGQALPAAWKSDCCVEYQDPVRAGPPHSVAVFPALWGT